MWWGGLCNFSVALLMYLLYWVLVFGSDRSWEGLGGVVSNYLKRLGDTL